MLESHEISTLDGRIARSHRTRAAIVDALIALLIKGNPQPTVEEIALRAGVAPRTVFQHYADRDTLFAAVSERRHAELVSLMSPIDRDAPLEARLDAFAAQRARLYEFIAPVRRAALLMEPFSDYVRGALEGLRATKRAGAIHVFGAELEAQPAAEREVLAAALVTATSWSAWDALRTQQGLDVAQASAAMRRLVQALFAGS